MRLLLKLTGRTLAISLLEYDSVQVQLSSQVLPLEQIADGLEASQYAYLCSIHPDLELGLIDSVIHRKSCDRRRLIALLLPRTREADGLRNPSYASRGFRVSR